MGKTDAVNLRQRVKADLKIMTRNSRQNNDIKKS